MDVSSVFVTQKGSKSQGSTQHELEAGRPLRIGRSDDNDIIWNEPWVSHYHCEILLQDFGMCTLKVISNNGISLVRGSAVHVVKAHKTSELMEGDYVILKGPHHARRDLQLHISFGGSTETKSSVVMKVLHVMDRIRGLERENTQLECKLQRGSVQAGTTTAISMSDATIIEGLEKRKAELQDRIIKQKIQWELEVHELQQAIRNNELIEQNKRSRASFDHINFMTRRAEEELDPLKRLEDWDHPGNERDKPLPYDEILEQEERLRLQDEANQLRLEDGPAKTSNTILNPCSEVATMEEGAETLNTLLNPTAGLAAMEEVAEASNIMLNPPSEAETRAEVGEESSTVLSPLSKVEATAEVGKTANAEINENSEATAGETQAAEGVTAAEACEEVVETINDTRQKKRKREEEGVTHEDMRNKLQTQMEGA